MRSSAMGAVHLPDMASTLPAIYWGFQRLDGQRQLQGRLFDLLGWGPRERPGRILLRQPAMEVKAYGAGAGPPVLLVPAPIKRAYLWDLAPGASVVECLLAGGVRPFLVQWQEADPATGLADYAGRLVEAAVQAVRAETGEARVFLAGHSLGGLFAALFACLHPERVRGVVIIGAPLHFSLDASAGQLGLAIARIAGDERLAELPGNLPGSLLTVASHGAATSAFGSERQRDWWDSLKDPEAFATHQRVERWCLDELPLARGLVIDLVRQLYGHDAFLKGSLRLGRKGVSPARFAAPVFLVGDRRCTVVPPAAMLPFLETIASTDKQVYWYGGDVGVGIQHVGPLVGRKALEQLWPAIIRWLGDH